MKKPSAPFFLLPPRVSSSLHICLGFCVGLLNCADMLWSSAEFATWEPGSCFSVQVRVCVHVRVRFTHVTDMGQPLTAVETHPYRRVFSKRIFSKLQITFAALVMWNHLASPASATLKKLRSSIIVCVCFLLSSQWQTGRRKATLIDVCSCRVVSFVHM